MLMMKLLPIWGMMLRSAWGRNHMEHGLPVGHADGHGALGLAGIDGDDAAADRLGHVGAGVDGDDEETRRATCPA